MRRLVIPKKVETDEPEEKPAPTKVIHDELIPMEKSKWIVVYFSKNFDKVSPAFRSMIADIVQYGKKGRLTRKQYETLKKSKNAIDGNW